jgi:release factor glutamine methyltransferase
MLPATGADGPGIRTLLAEARGALGAEEARDAARLLAAALGCSLAYLHAHPEVVPVAAATARFRAMLARRCRGEPLAYITGRRGFWSLELEVSPETLVPRPETELLVEVGLQAFGTQPIEVLDLGTGSGAVALALARERPAWTVLGVDIAAAAVAVARANAARLGLGNARFVRGDWYSAVTGQRFALIVANPPYVRADDPALEAPALGFEPRQALVSGADGLEALRTIAGGAPRHLRVGGVLACEHGAEQGEAVRALFAAAGFDEVRTLPDLAGHERVTRGCRGEGAGDE